MRSIRTLWAVDSNMYSILASLAVWYWCFQIRNIPPKVVRERNGVADEDEAIMLIPVVRSIVRIEVALRVIPVRVGSVQRDTHMISLMLYIISYFSKQKYFFGDFRFGLFFCLSFFKSMQGAYRYEYNKCNDNKINN